MAAFGYRDIPYIPNGGGQVVNRKLQGWCQYGIRSYTVPNGVDTIEEGFFDGRSTLETVVLPVTLTAIPPNCFRSCTNLKSVVIPSSVQSIGYNAFMECKSLRSITIPASVKTIGNYAFQDCEELKSVSLPYSIREIGAFTFSGCKSLENINLPETVVKIGGSAFYGCSKLNRIVLPQTLRDIGSRAFAYCDIASITVPPTVTSIGEDVFYFCEKLKQVVLPNSLTEIPESAFSGCKELSKINLPTALKKIGKKAFWFCKGLISLELPEALEEIGESAFFACDKLTAVSFGNRIRTIGNGAFSVCGFKHACFPASLINIFESDFQYISVSRNCNYGSIVKEDVVIAEGTVAIRPHAFDGADIKTVSFPDSVTEIGEYAFANCKEIEIRRIPAKLKSIGTRAFSHCEISRIALPATVEFIGTSAFREGSVVTISGVDADEWWKKIEFKKAQTNEQNTITSYQRQITNTENLILETAGSLSETEAQLTEKEDHYARLLAEMPGYQTRFREAKNELDKNTEACEQVVIPLKNELSRLKEELQLLEQELQDTFFLNFSKRSGISQQISSKRQEIQNTEEEFNAAEEHFNAVIIPLKEASDSAEAAYTAHVEKCQNLEGELEALKKKRELSAQKKENLENQHRELLKNLTAAEEKNRKNEAVRIRQLETLRKKAAEREDNLKLAAKQKQKRKLLEALNPKIEEIERVKSGVPQKKHTNPDETLLNESYAGLTNWENKCRTAEQMEKFLKSNQKELEKLKELNLSLGLEENDGLLSLPEDESIQEWTTNDFPTRIAGLSKLFMQEGSWKHLKNLLRSKKQSISDTRRKAFFSGRELAVLHCDKYTTLVFLPYCVIGYASGTDMWQMFYDELQISIKCEEFESTKVNKGCEEIGNHYQHETKDGGKDMRYSSNPLIHQWRKTTVTIKCRKDRYTYTATTKSEAEELKDLVEAHAAELNSSAFTNIYSAIKAFRPIEEIEGTLADYRDLQKQQLKSKKEKLAAEQEKAKREADDRRRKLIAKQRERNTQKRFDEIIVSSEDISTDASDWEVTPSATRPVTSEAAPIPAIAAVAKALQNTDPAFSLVAEHGLILTSKSRTVTNNIFSVEFLYQPGPEIEGDSQSRSVVMTDALGNVVSEITTVPCNEGESCRVMMTLKQMSFNKNDRYYLAVINDTLGSVESLTPYKINIAFSNLFDNDFGL